MAPNGSIEISEKLPPVGIRVDFWLHSGVYRTGYTAKLERVLINPGCETVFLSHAVDVKRVYFAEDVYSWRPAVDWRQTNETPE